MRRQRDELLGRWRESCDEFGDSIWLFAINFGFVDRWRTIPSPPSASSGRATRPCAGLARRATSRRSPDCSRAPCAHRDATTRPIALTRESEEAARPNDIHSHILWRTARAQVLAPRGRPRGRRGTRTRGGGIRGRQRLSRTPTATLSMILADVRAQAGAQRTPSQTPDAPSSSTSRRAMSFQRKGAARRLSDLEVTASAMGG